MSRVDTRPAHDDLFHFHVHGECRVLTESVMEHLPGAPERGKARRVAKGTLVYAMGDPTGDVFFLRKGRIGISVVSPDGRERRLQIVEPDEMFGELCFCDIRTRQDQAMALADSEIVALRMDDLLDALLRSPAGTAAMLGTLCARVADAQALVQRLAFHSAPQRIGLLLLSLTGTETAQKDGGRVISKPPTHEEIAQSVSASRELVSSTLSGFRRLGLMRYRRQSAVVVYPEALTRHLGLRGSSRTSHHLLLATPYARLGRSARGSDSLRPIVWTISSPGSDRSAEMDLLPAPFI